MRARRDRKGEGAGAGLCGRCHGREDRPSVRKGGRARPARRSRLHVPGGSRPPVSKRAFRDDRAALPWPPIAASMRGRPTNCEKLLACRSPPTRPVEIKALDDLSARRNAGAIKLLEQMRIDMPTIFIGLSWRWPWFCGSQNRSPKADPKYMIKRGDGTAGGIVRAGPARPSSG